MAGRFSSILVSALIMSVIASVVPASALEVLDYVYNIRQGGTVVFSHDKHLHALISGESAKGDDCVICHTTIYKPQNKHPFTMAEMEKGKSCGACHGKRAFSLKACGRCHTVRDVTFKVFPTGNIIFPHTPHIKKIQCDVCHPRLFKPGRNRPVSMAEMEKGKSCGACHKGKKAFALEDCSRCHLAGNVVMRAKTPWAVTFSHAYHVPAYHCTDCHPKIFRLGYTKARPRLTMSDMDSSKSCGACHDGKTAFTTRFNCMRCHDNM